MLFNMHWNELKVGDVFQIQNCDHAIKHFYMKIDGKAEPYNCVLLNKGEICNIHVENLRFSKVELAFE
jgi:hypothetical protein